MTSGEEIKRSVFTDSDFETIRTESVHGLQKQNDYQMEWTTTILQLSDLHKHYLNLSKVRKHHRILFILVDFDLNFQLFFIFFASK